MFVRQKYGGRRVRHVAASSVRAVQRVARCAAHGNSAQARTQCHNGAYTGLLPPRWGMEALPLGNKYCRNGQALGLVAPPQISSHDRFRPRSTAAVLCRQRPRLLPAHRATSREWLTMRIIHCLPCRSPIQPASLLPLSLFLLFLSSSSLLLLPSLFFISSRMYLFAQRCQYEVGTGSVRRRDGAVKCENCKNDVQRGGCAGKGR